MGLSSAWPSHLCAAAELAGVPCFGISLRPAARIDFVMDRCQYRLRLKAGPAEYSAEAWLNRDDDRVAPMEAASKVGEFIGELYSQLRVVDEDRDF